MARLAAASPTLSTRRLSQRQHTLLFALSQMYMPPSNLHIRGQIRLHHTLTSATSAPVSSFRAPKPGPRVTLALAASHPSLCLEIGSSPELPHLSHDAPHRQGHTCQTPSLSFFGGSLLYHRSFTQSGVTTSMPCRSDPTAAAPVP